MEPATLTAIAVSILLQWAFSAITQEDPEPIRRSCTRKIEAVDTVDGKEVFEPVWCDEVELKEGGTL